MQAAHVKYLKLNQHGLCILYHELTTLYYKVSVQGGWSYPKTLASNVSSTFSIAEHQNFAYVLYSTLDGNIVLAKTSDFSHWDYRQLISGRKDLIRTKFFILPEEDKFHMIYHLPTELTCIHSLVYAVSENGQWNTPYKIDRFMPFQNVSFFARKVRENHIILYYRTARNVISAREMLLSPYTIGSVNPIIQTPYPCIDLSILNNSERIHLLYIVKSMFRCQVVYQYKEATSISTPRVLWEGSNCENCMVYQQDDKLHFMWIGNGQPYHCCSTDNGGSFQAVEKYTAAFPRRCTKGEFISAEKSPLFDASELYGDIDSNFQPLQFFEKEQPPIPTFPMQDVALSAFPNISASEDYHNPSIYPRNGSQFKTTTESQQEQIDELSRLLAQRSEEIGSINAKWRETVAQLEKALAAEKAKNSQLSKEIELLKNNIACLEKSNREASPLSQDESAPSS
ncbi:MAG: coiled-coil domain-containing protein 22 [Epulopiscium sp.]|nr:coiled-coil domain-containing protein 22 [Candidatus Epulonipiscium sp.]